MTLLPTAVALLALQVIPIGSPGGPHASQGIYFDLQASPGGRPEGRRPLFVLPGDAPPCFDVAVGPIRPRPAGDPPSPLQLGCVVEVLAAADAKGSLFSDVGPDWEGYAPVADGSGLTVTWAGVVPRGGLFTDIDQLSDMTFSRGQFCLESAVPGEYYVAVSAPADSLRGQPFVASEEPDAEAQATPRIHSCAYWVRFGPPPTEPGDRDLQALIDRAMRLDHEEDVLRWSLRWLALQPDSFTRLYTVGMAYEDLNRLAEAVPYLERAMKECEAWPGCVGSYDFYGHAAGIVRAYRERAK